LGGFNSFRLTAPPGYVWMYVDFNQDGDFEDRGELVYQPRVKSQIPAIGGNLIGYGWNALTVDQFSLSDTVASYRAALGKLLRYRVLVTDTNTQGACGHYRYGIATDGRLRLHPTLAGPASFSQIHTLNDAGSAAYKEVRPGPQGSVYGAGEAAGLVWNPPQVVWHFGMSQISVSDTMGATAKYYTGGYHHSYMGTSNVVTRYNRRGGLDWFRVMDGYGDDGGVGGSGKVDITGSAATPDSGITALCHVESGIVYLEGMDSATIGQSYIDHGWDRTLVVRYRPDGRIAMAHDFASPQARYNPASCAYGQDGSLYAFGSAAGLSWPAGVPKIQGPLRDTIALQDRGRGDAVLVKLLPDNRLGWMLKVEGPTAQSCLKLALGTQGRIYLAGTFDTAATVVSTASATTLTLRGQGAHSGYLVALSDSGRPLWSRTWSLSDSNWAAGYPYGSLSVPVQLATDVSGQNIVLTGAFRDQLTLDSTILRSEGGVDAYGLGFGPDGGLRWAKSFGTPNDESVTALGQEPGGRLAVSIRYQEPVDHVFGYGRLSGSGGDNVALLYIHPATGQVGARTGFAQFSGAGVRISGLHALPGGKLLLAGQTDGQSLLRRWGVLGSGGFIGMADLAVDTVRYAGPTAVHTAQNNARKLEVYPNPSTGRVFLRQALVEGRMPVAVFDAQGRLLLNQYAEAEELRTGYSLPIRLQPGFYLVRCGERTGRLVVE